METPSATCRQPRRDGRATTRTRNSSFSPRLARRCRPRWTMPQPSSALRNWWLVSWPTAAPSTSWRRMGHVRRMRVVYADTAKAGSPMPSSRSRPTAIVRIPWKVLETKQPLLIAEVTHDSFAPIAQDEEHLRLLESLGLRSVILVPLVARGRLMAVLTIASCRAGPQVWSRGLASGRGARSTRITRAGQCSTSTRSRRRPSRRGIRCWALWRTICEIRLEPSSCRHRCFGGRIGEPERQSRKAADRIERAATRMNRLIRTCST